MKYKKPKNCSLVLRVCRPDFTSHGGFKWPEEVGATVTAPDWEDNQECGSGLHGWLYGQGDHACVSHWKQKGAKWLALEVETSMIVALGRKCKFPQATIRFIGTGSEAAAFLLQHEPNAKNTAVIGACIQVGDGENVAVGPLGTATAGESGTATAGYRGTATAGNYGTATAGNYGTATAGESGTATAGKSGTATAGYRGTATAGNYGEIRIRWWDPKAQRYRTEIAYVGENGIKPNTPYRLNENHQFVEA